MPRSPLRANVRADVFADEVFYRIRMCLDTCCVFSHNCLSCLSTSKMSLMEKDQRIVCVSALEPRTVFARSDYAAFRKMTVQGLYEHSDQPSLSP